MKKDEKIRKDDEEERKKVEEAIFNIDQLIRGLYRETHPQTDPSEFGYPKLPIVIAPQKSGSGSKK